MKIINTTILIVMLVGCSFSDDDSGVVTSHEPVDSYGNQLIQDPLPSFCSGSGCVATDFETTEYYTNYGGNQNFLGQINASSAYAYLANAGKSWGGNDVKVVVVDTGVFATHTNLDGNYSSVSESTSNQDTDGHGTHVAGIVAGEKNGQSMHGVSPYAKIVSVALTGLKGITYGTSDWAGAVISTGSTVVNSSWTGEGQLSNIQSIINDNSKRVVVFSAGNSDETNPDYPARYAHEVSLNGQMLAVISVNSSNVRSNWGGGSASSQCGVTKAFCIAAPGHLVYSSYNNGGYALLGGTSMAAPVVSGAVAVLQAAWPSLTGAQIVSLLISTATDLGAAGVDDEYGNGLLNLYAAVQNQGASAVYTSSSGPQYSYDNTNIYLPSSMGVVINNSQLQASFREGVFFDSYGRDYQDDYNKKIITYGQTDKFFNFFEDHNREIDTIGFNNQNNLTLHLSRDINHNSDKISLSAVEKTQYHLNELSYNFNLGKVGFNIGKTSKISSPDSKFQSLNLVTGASYLDSYDQIAKYDLLNFKSNINLTKNISFQNKFIYGENEYTDTSLKGIVNQLSHNINNIRFNYEFSLYQEDNSLYGITGNGAFNIAEQSNNKSFGISLLSQSKGKLNYFFSSKWSKTTPEYNNSLISGDKEFTSASYVLGAIYDKNKSNKLGMSIAKPWTVDQGSLFFTIPTGLSDDGVVQTKSISVDLASYNETDYEVFWYKKLKSDNQIKINLVQRIYDLDIAGTNINDTTELYVQYSKNF